MTLSAMDASDCCPRYIQPQESEELLYWEYDIEQETFKLELSGLLMAPITGLVPLQGLGVGDVKEAAKQDFSESS